MKRTLVRYGSDRAQVAEVWRPPGAVSDRPVVVLIHGGFWRQPYTRRLMHRMARAIVAHGWVAYNIEYRRLGRFGGGWPETFDDVRDALDALAAVDGVDRERIVTCGHSAGGHLALVGGLGSLQRDRVAGAIGWRPRPHGDLARRCRRPRGSGPSPHRGRRGRRPDGRGPG
jgi:acetyl esterase/lipase